MREEDEEVVDRQRVLDGVRREEVERRGATLEREDANVEGERCGDQRPKRAQRAVVHRLDRARRAQRLAQLARADRAGAVAVDHREDRALVRLAALHLERVDQLGEGADVELLRQGCGTASIISSIWRYCPSSATQTVHSRASSSGDVSTAACISGAATRGAAAASDACQRRIAMQVGGGAAACGSGARGVAARGSKCCRTPPWQASAPAPASTSSCGASSIGGDATARAATQVLMVFASRGSPPQRAHNPRRRRRAVGQRHAEALGPPPAAASGARPSASASRVLLLGFGGRAVRQQPAHGGDASATSPTARCSCWRCPPARRRCCSTLAAARATAAARSSAPATRGSAST